MIPACGPPYPASMAWTPAIGELYKAKVIIEDAIEAVFMAHLIWATAFPMGDSYKLDLVAAVAASKFAREAVVSPDAAEPLKRAAVLSAILLARPVEG